MTSLVDRISEAGDGPLHKIRVSPDELREILAALRAHGGEATADALAKTTPVEFDADGRSFRTIMMGSPVLATVVEAVRHHCGARA